MSQDDINPKKKYINGPVNAIRLEGKIGSVKKVIYLFLDFHMQVEHQTQCTNIYADDFSKYLLNGFLEAKRTKRQIDFFLEIDSAMEGTTKYYTDVAGAKIRDRKMMYIRALRHIFLKLFNYDQEKNKVFQSQFIDNIRVHYADFRYLFDEPHSGMLLTNLEHSVSVIYELTNSRENTVITKLAHVVEEFRSFQDIFEECFQNDILCRTKAKLIPEIKDKEDIHNRFRYIFQKMIYKYKHSSVQKVMQDLLRIEQKKIPQIIKLLQNYSKLLINTHKKLMQTYHHRRPPSSDINNKFDYLPYNYQTADTIKMEIPLYESLSRLEYLVNKMVGYMDIFFLRRFLDKDYITTGVVYAGAFHCGNYVRILVQKFNFKITHVSNSNGMTIPQLNTAIKKTKHPVEANYLLVPEVLEQCADMSSFPQNFK